MNNVKFGAPEPKALCNFLLYESLDFVVYNSVSERKRKKAPCCDVPSYHTAFVATIMVLYSEESTEAKLTRQLKLLCDVFWVHSD